jgi:DNA-binding LacI/PurR family transcriptional regulator
MATIKEIAARANVSIATVSKVLNNRGGASEETKARILKLAKEMNYTPNIIAKNLKSRKSDTIGIITEDLTVFNTPEIVDGIDYSCDQNGYHYILGNLRLNKRFGHDFFETDLHHHIINSTIRTMLSRQVEGIIYVGCHNHEIQYLPKDLKIPLVCAYCYNSNPETPSVIYDDKKAGYDATVQLIKNGHTKIGVICGLPDSLHTQNRLLGYQKALYDSSILYNPNLVMYGNWERESGYNLCKPLMDRGVTAIFCNNDEMACGVIDYCNETGIAVGKDLSLMGFDNREIGEVVRPKLSTVSLPLFEIGQKATEIILSMITGAYKNKNKEHHLKIECSLIERDSVTRI